jgi:ribosome-associated translation inhibitor RaiA
MLVQVHTDSNIRGDSALAAWVEAAVRDAIDRFSDRITRVAVHLSDENSASKAGSEVKRCLLEARVAGLRPISVSERADTLELAVDGAAAKLIRSLESTLGRLDDR